MPFDIDVSGAAAAMDNAGGVEHLMSTQDGDPTPQEAPTPQGSEDATRQYARDEQGRFTPQQPQEQPVEDTFTPVDPNTLPPELQAIYKSLQGDYTRKTQELAAQRKQYEQYGQIPLDEAVQLYQAVQNPSYWPQLYQELKEGMEAYGMTPQEAAQAAAEEVQRQQNQQSDPLSALDDPDFAPIKEAYQGMRSELEQLKAELEQQREAERQEQLQMALIGELQRQENMVRQANPHYTDSDINAIYELSSYHNGNLLEAQQRYESIISDRLARYLSQKQGAVQTHGAPMPGAGTQTQEETPRFTSLDDAHVAAMERLRQIEALDQ